MNEKINKIKNQIKQVSLFLEKNKSTFLDNQYVTIKQAINQLNQKLIEKEIEMESDEDLEEYYYINKLNQYSFKDKRDKDTLISLFNFLRDKKDSEKYSNYLFKQYKDLEQIFKYQNIETDDYLDEDMKKIMKSLIFIKEEIETTILEKDPNKQTQLKLVTANPQLIDVFFKNKSSIFYAENKINICFLSPQGDMKEIVAYPNPVTFLDLLDVDTMKKVIKFVLKEAIKKKRLMFILTIAISFENLLKMQVPATIDKEMAKKVKASFMGGTKGQKERQQLEFLMKLAQFLNEEIFRYWQDFQLVDIFVFFKYKEKDGAITVNINSVQREFSAEMEEAKQAQLVQMMKAMGLGGTLSEEDNEEEIYTAQELFCRIDKKKCISDDFYKLSYKDIFLTDIEYLRNYNISEKILNFINVYSQVLYKIFFLPVKQIIAKDMKSFVTSDQVKIYLLTFFAYKTIENFSIIFLTDENKIIKHEIMSIGSIASASLEIRDVAHLIDKYDAKKLIFIHNHPSGTSSFSEEDKKATVAMRKALLYIDVDIIDHFLIAGNEIKSMLEEVPEIFKEMRV